MKGRTQHVFLLLLGLLLSKFAVAQVPDAVLHSFATTYSDTTDVQWSEQQRYHQANFGDADQTSIAVFDPIGKCVATGHVIPMDSLPQNIAQQLEGMFDQRPPVQIERLHYLNGGVLYRCTFHEGATTIVVELDAQGRLVGPEDEGQD
jgi:hypothetical protein